MTVRDAARLDAILALHWRDDADMMDGTKTLVCHHEDDGTRAREMEQQLEIALRRLAAIRNALRRPFAVGSAKILAAGVPKLSPKYEQYLHDLLLDLQEAGNVIATERRRQRRRK